MHQKLMGHLHNRMLHITKEGAPTLSSCMDGSGVYGAKLNKPGGEREIPYDLSCKLNLVNKTNKQAKYKQRH